VIQQSKKKHQIKDIGASAGKKIKQESKQKLESHRREERKKKGFFECI